MASWRASLVRALREIDRVIATALKIVKNPSAIKLARSK